MKVKRTSVVVLVWLLAGFCLATDAKAQRKWNYSSSSAVAYAVGNYNVKYGRKRNQNPFTDFGDNCANFVSQSILAGLTGKSTPSDVFSERYNFTIDRGAHLSWYFISSSDRGPAWTGAKKLYEYALYNKPIFRGLHFAYIANDAPQYRMNYKSVKKGDVIFSDWESDGIIDHVMIVTKVYSSLFSRYRGYNKIRVTYQSNNKTNRGLEDINNQYNREVSFHVYRPVNYKESGL